MINNQAARFNFGFASNLMLLFWCVCGGFLLYMFESTYLTMLMKPTYEKPVDTAEDILDRGLSVIKSNIAAAIVEAEKNSSFAIIRELAERTIIPKVISFYFNFNIKFL